jgi:protein-tyrosine phosphatase
VEFIDAERKADHQTYVHCRNGVNRSAFVVVAYLMYSEKMTRDEALKFVQAKRSVRPNPIFMERLLEWEKEIKK